MSFFLPIKNPLIRKVSAASFFTLWAGFIFPAHAASPSLNAHPLTASLSIPNSHATAGKPVVANIHISLDPHFHAYADRFALKPSIPSNVQVSKIHIAPTVNFFDKVTNKWREGVYKKADVRAEIIFSSATPPGPIPLQLNLIYQACSEEFCLLPKTVRLETNLEILAPVAENTPPATTGPSWLKFQNFEQALEKGPWAALLLMFIAGILTSFTPCIFPMIPITLSIIGTRSIGQSRLRSFLLSVCYVFGIALTYSILGIFAAKTGRIFGAALSSPVVVLAVALVFVVMGLSMYGLFELQIPSFIRNRLGRTQSGTGFFGAFASGLITGIVASPCVGPVLVSVLTFVAHSQNTLLGFWLLFVFALGMGLLFIVLGTFSHLLNRLPRAGAWMNVTKIIFGTMMMFMAYWYARPIIQNWSRTQPPLTATLSEIPADNHSLKTKPKTQWVPYSEGAFDEGLQLRRPVIIDFYADWCGACAELENETFSDRSVQEALQGFMLLRFDATTESAEFAKLKNKYQIVGLPMIIFYDSNGQLRTDLTLSGFETPNEFLARLQKLK